MLKDQARRWRGIPSANEDSLVKDLYSQVNKNLKPWKVKWKCFLGKRQLSVLLIACMCVLVVSLVGGETLVVVHHHHRVVETLSEDHGLAVAATRGNHKEIDAIVKEYEEAVGLRWREEEKVLNLSETVPPTIATAPIAEYDPDEAIKESRIEIRVPPKSFAERRFDWTTVLNCKRKGKLFWYGRLGNNIITMASLVAEAYTKRTRFATWQCEHEMLNTSMVALDEERDVPVQLYDAEDLYFRGVTDMVQIQKTRLIQKKIPKNANMLPLEFRPLYQRYMQRMLISGIEGPSTCDKGLFYVSKNNETESSPAVTSSSDSPSGGSKTKTINDAVTTKPASILTINSILNHGRSSTTEKEDLKVVVPIEKVSRNVTISHTVNNRKGMVHGRRTTSFERTNDTFIASSTNENNNYSHRDDDRMRKAQAEQKEPATCRVFDAEKNIDRLHEYLVVHLRSGDSFAQPGKESEFGEWTYRPPPVSYFKKVIATRTSKKKVLLVMECEDRMIVARELCAWRPDIIEIYSGSLKSDVHLVREAEALMISHGTFAWSIGLVSTKLKELYCFYGEFIPVDCRFPGVKSRMYSSIRDYLLDWNSSPEQIEEMKTFPEDHIVEI